MPHEAYMHIVTGQQVTRGYDSAGLRVVVLQEYALM